MRILSFVCVFISLVCCSGGVIAGKNVENKGVKISYYLFGEDTEWKLYSSHNGSSESEWLSANKSGSIKNYKHIYHYHLDIDKDKLKLRLSIQDKNDKKKYDLEPDNLVIKNVAIDGERLSLFQWCLDNQKPSSNVLDHSAQVKDAACTNSKDIGEFILRLDEKTKKSLLFAKNIGIYFLIDDEEINLEYSMHGFAEVMHQVDSGLMLQKEKPDGKSSICYLKPSNELKSIINAIPYPCGNEIKQAMAQGFLSAQIQHEMQRMNDEKLIKKSSASSVKSNKKSRTKKNKVNKEKNMASLVDAKIALSKALNKTSQDREREWEIGQSVMWINRCKKRWDNGVSPCYCKKYFHQAPVGVKSTCD